MRLPKPNLVVIAVFLIINLSLSPDSEPGTAYTPYLIAKEDLANSVFMQAAREFENPGKIYLYGNKIYIVDLFRGVHVIDNQNRLAPVKTGFIHIPGVKDIAIKDSVLYADNAIDLVAIDIRAYPVISVIDRVELVFPEPLPPDLTFIPHRYSRQNRPDNTVLVGWFNKRALPRP